MNESTPLPASAATGQGKQDDAAKRLRHLWLQGGRPDACEFLAGCGALPWAEVAAVLRADQCHRWESGEHILAETYLRQYPNLANHAESALDLIYGEWLLRERAGEAVNLDDFLARFPQHGPVLRMQVELHQAIAQYRPNDADKAPPTQDAIPDPATVTVTEGDAPPSEPSSAPAARSGLPRLTGYDVLHEVGRGGMGVVYKAWHLPLKRVVALKMLLAGPDAGPDQLVRFRAEAEAVARLQHPNIIQIFDVGDVDGRPFLALEYVDGGSLGDQLSGLPQPARPAAALVETLARAMHYAHQHGIVHRDLKPANVLLNEAIPKITDFGLAKRLGGDPGGAGTGGQTHSGDILGTPSYMAPEQAMGRRSTLGPAADVYSLGAILYQLLTGRPPFLGATPFDTLQQVLTEDPIPPARLQPGLRPDLGTICLKCLQKEPAQRYASALDLAEDLRRFLAGEPILARPVGWAVRAARWCRRNPAVAGLLSLVLTLTIAAFTVVTVLWARAERLRVQAETDRAGALADFRLARDSVNAYTARMSEDQQLRQGDLRPLRKSLLEAIVPICEILVERHADDPEVQADRGKAYLRLATITDEIGDKSKAISLYQKALPVLEEYLRAHPGDRDCTRDVTACRVNVAGIYHLTGRLAEAEAEYKLLLAWQSQLARDNPGEVQYQQDLAHNHNNLAVLYLDVNRPNEAVTEEEKTIQVIRKLADADPTPANRRRLASCQSVLAVMCQAAGNDRRAEEEYNTATAALEDLIAKEPDDTAHQQELAYVLAQTVKLYMKTDRNARAVAPCERARGLLEAVVRKEPSVGETRRDLARCLTSLAALYQRIGRDTDAEPLYRRAIALCEELRAQNPKVHYYRGYLAVAYRALGVLLLDTGRHAQAEDELRKALDLNEQLAEENPGQSGYAVEAALSRNNLAAVYEETGRTALAEPEYEKAIARLTLLAEAHRAKQEYDGLLVKCQLSLATLYYKTARLARSKELHGEVLLSAEALEHAHPGRREYVLAVALSQLGLGTVAEMGGDGTAAVAWLDKSIEVLRGRLATDAEDVEALRRLRDARACRARALSRLGHHADAVKECDEALTIDTRLPRDSTRALHALMLGRQGQWAPALAEADVVSESQKLTGSGLYDLGRIYALKAAAIVADQGLPAATRATAAEKAAARAVEMLVRAQATGFFGGASFVEQLKQDTDLDILRTRGEFQTLLAAVEKQLKLR